MPFDPSQFFSLINTPTAHTVIFILRIVFIIISAGLLGFIIWALIKTTYLQKLFFWDFKEFTSVKPYGAKKLYEPWQKIKARLEAGLESEYKLAVIEADLLLDDVFKNMGFSGTTFSERLSNLTEATLPNMRSLQEAHEIRNNIVHNPDSHLTLGEAKRTLESYETALTDLQAL